MLLWCLFELFLPRAEVLTWTICFSVLMRLMLYRVVWGGALDYDCINSRDRADKQSSGQRSRTQCCNKEWVISAKFSRHEASSWDFMKKKKKFLSEDKISVNKQTNNLRFYFCLAVSIRLIIFVWIHCCFSKTSFSNHAHDVVCCLFSLQGGGIGSVWPMILQVLCGTEADSPSLWAQWSRRRTGTSTWPCGV